MVCSCVVCKNYLMTLILILSSSEHGNLTKDVRINAQATEMIVEIIITDHFQCGLPVAVKAGDHLWRNR